MIYNQMASQRRQARCQAGSALPMIARDGRAARRHASMFAERYGLARIPAAPFATTCRSICFEHMMAAKIPAPPRYPAYLRRRVAPQHASAQFRHPITRRYHYRQRRLRTVDACFFTRGMSHVDVVERTTPLQKIIPSRTSRHA